MQAEAAQQLGEQNSSGSVQSCLSAQPPQGRCELLFAPYDPYSNSCRARALGPCFLGQPFPKYAGGRLISANLIQLTIALNQTSEKPWVPVKTDSCWEVKGSKLLRWGKMQSPVTSEGRNSGQGLVWKVLVVAGQWPYVVTLQGSWWAGPVGIILGARCRRGLWPDT